jgi:spore coat protein H
MFIHSKKENKMKNKSIILGCIVAVLISSCYKEIFVASGEGLEDWTTATHSSIAPVDYDVVFPQDKVNRFDITISAADWDTMQSDLNNLYGSSETTDGPGAGGPPTGSGGNGFSDETPIYIPCNVEFDGLNWYNVGIRYKGNSSLSAASSGVKKLPFRMEFNEFEDEYTEIKGQTFYGFPALSMSSNYNDKSFLREKIACDLFREFEVPAPKTAFYEMYIDYGDGPIYFGLYTALEIVFETMLNKQFGSESGNCYKPDGTGASFSPTGWNLSHFENKTNGVDGDTDIQTFYDILHSDTRTTDEVSWKTDMESVFDVDGFLKWLAVNTTIQNWDTYGRMTHNYYLYNDPADDLIKWIPWDNNEALEEGKQGGALVFEFTSITNEDWPLIGYILGVPSFKVTFKQHINSFITGAFESSKMQAYYAQMQSLIQSSVDAETSDYSFLTSTTDFSSAIGDLNTHVDARYVVAYDYAN